MKQSYIYFNPYALLKNNQIKESQIENRIQKVTATSSSKSKSLESVNLLTTEN